MPCKLFACLWILALVAGCSRAPAPATLTSPLRLGLALEREHYAPGEPVVAELTLINDGPEPLTVFLPDAADVEFALAARTPDAPAGPRFVRPVEEAADAPPAEPLELGAGQSARRAFVFTVLTLERGPFALTAACRVPDADHPAGERRVYAEAAGFEVSGEKAFARRYPDGLLAREDAVAIARRELGAPAEAPGETLLVVDGGGRARWWVNLGEGEGARAGLVDPVFARWLGPLRPFTASERHGVEPAVGDNKALRTLKARQPWKRFEP